MTSDAPLFRQLAASLSGAIAGGEFRVGDPLPTEMELMARYGVSRHTVRAALMELKTRGIVAARRGIGTIVRRADPASSYIESYSSVDELFTFAAGRPIAPIRVTWNDVGEAEARRLGMKPGRRCLVIEGLRHGGGELPVAFVRIHLDERYGRIADSLDGLQTSVAELIEREFDLRIGRIEQEIESGLIDQPMASLLSVAAGTPALHITRWYYASGEQPVEVAESVYPQGRFVYRNELVRAGPHGQSA
ncbi:MAG: GntR family transcriptional regulator [Azospirillaceae bacterium]